MVFNLFDKRKIITVAGDIMLDQYWFGEVERISQEAPVPIVDVSDEQFRPGGAANVALNIANLGLKVNLLGVVGNDENQKKLKEILKLRNLNYNFIISKKGTIKKLRIISKGNQMIRVDFEKPFSKENQEQLFEMWKKDNKNQDLLILSDYNKGSINPKDWIEVSLKKNIPIIVDPKGSNFEKYSGVTCITPNLFEFEKVVGKVNNNEDILDKALKLLKSLSINSILVTLSEKGMILILKNGEHYHYNSKAIEVNDVTGAGDTVISVLASCIVSGLNINQAAKIANEAAGVVVSKIGTVSITNDDILKNKLISGEISSL